jgi:hypothetical protein
VKFVRATLIDANAQAVIVKAVRAALWNARAHAVVVECRVASAFRTALA